MPNPFTHCLPTAGRLLALLTLAFGPLVAAQAQNPPNVSYSGPLTITRGGTYTGNYRSADSSTPCVRINTTDSVVLENCVLVGPGDLVQGGTGTDVVVRNCRGYGLTPTNGSNPHGRFVDVYQGKRLTVEHNYFEHTTGIVVNRWSGTGAGNTVTIRYNQGLNCDGRNASGNASSSRNSFVLLNTVTSLPGIDIGYNQFINEPNQSAVEDNINLYNTSGTAQSPIRVHDNYVQGAYPVPATASTFHGSGMTTDGDNNFLLTPAYVEAYENQFVSTCNAAMNIASGHDIHYHDNRMVTSAQLPDGTRLNATWAGAGVFNYYNLPASVFFNNSITGNVIGYVKPGYNVPFQDRHDLSTNNCAPCAGNTHLPNPVTVQTEQDEFGRWQQKLQQLGITIGAAGSNPSTPPAPTSPTTPTVQPLVNLLVNPGFEAGGQATQNPSGWQVRTSGGTQAYASYTEGWPSARTGSFHGTHYRPEAYQVQTYQLLTGLPSGSYTLKAWVQSSGSQAKLQASSFGGSTRQTAIPAGSGQWRLVELTNIVVSSGQCEVALVTQSTGNSEWMYFDDVEFFLQSTSPPPTPANVAPTISLTTPASAVASTSLTLTATAADADGSVTKVEFLVDGRKVGEATAAPYQVSWTPTTAGNYSLTATATDNQGATTTSAAVALAVTTPPTPAPPTTPPTPTTVQPLVNLLVNPSFEDGGQGTRTPNGWQVRTFGNTSATASYTETYGGSRTGALHATHYHSDAFHIQTYQLVTGLPNGSYTLKAWVKSSAAQASLQASNFGGNTLQTSIPIGFGQWRQVELTGIAVSNGQCEVSFVSNAYGYQALYLDDAEFFLQSATTPPPTTPANVTPTVSLTVPASAVANTGLSLAATAADPDGTITKVEFLVDGSKVGEATAAPYQTTWTPTAAGSYSLTAVATDNQGATTTSSAVVLTVAAPSTPSPTTPAPPTTVQPLVNLLVNPSFEDGGQGTRTPNGWQVRTFGNTSATASYTETYGGSRTGALHATHYHYNAFQLQTYQLVTGLPNGLYTFRAWVQSSTARAYLQVSSFGGNTQQAGIPVGFGLWRLVELRDIAVSNGQCEVAFASDAYGYQTLYLDDAEFFLQAGPAGARAADAQAAAARPAEVQEAAAPLSLHPSTADTEVAVEAAFEHSGTADIRIVSIQGQPVAHFERTVQAGDNHLVFPTATLPEGMYLLQVRDQQGLRMKRFFLHH